MLFATFATIGCSAEIDNEARIADVFVAQEPRVIAQMACRGDVDDVKSVIGQHPSAINTKGLYDVTPLIWALTCHGLEFPDLAANRFIKNSGKEREQSANAPHLDSLEVLLKAGADPNSFIAGGFGPVYPGEVHPWIDGYSPVLIAAEFHGSEVLNLLLKYGGDPNAKSLNREHTALSLGLSRGRWLDLGQQMSPFDDRQWENYFMLLDAGANASEKLGHGQNVVEVASLTRPEIVLRTLKAYPYDGDYETITDLTIDAIETGYPNLDVRRELLEFLREEKYVDVDGALLAYKAYAESMSDRSD